MILTASVFCWAGASKLADSTEAQSILEFVVGRSVPTIAFQILGAFELAIGAWLFSGLARQLGTMIAVFAVFSFSAFIAIAISMGFRGTCGCLGLEETALSSLYRNAILLGMLGAGCLVGSTRGSTRGQMEVES